MKPVRWDPLKSRRLKKTRGVSFEEILGTEYLITKKHPGKDHQWIMLYKRKDYVWVIPFVESEGEIFLKTLYPSRYWNKRYKEGLL